jgi:uncharacterized protein YbaR (Trm112 family)
MEKPILSCPKCGNPLKRFGNRKFENYKCISKDCGRFYSAEKLDEMGV